MNKVRGTSLFLIRIFLWCMSVHFGYAKILRDPFSYCSKDLIGKYKCKAIGKVHLTDKMEPTSENCPGLFAIVSFDNQLKAITTSDTFDQNKVIDIIDDRIIIQDRNFNTLQIELEKDEV